VGGCSIALTSKLLTATIHPLMQPAACLNVKKEVALREPAFFQPIRGL